MPDRHIAVLALVNNAGLVEAVQSNTVLVATGDHEFWPTPPVLPGYTFGFTAGFPAEVSIEVDASHWVGSSAASWTAGTTDSFTDNFTYWGGGTESFTFYIHRRAVPVDFLLVDGQATTLSVPAVAGHTLAFTAGGGELTLAGGAGSYTVTKNGDAWTTPDAEFDLTMTLDDGSPVSTALLTGAGTRPTRRLRRRQTASGTAVAGYTHMQLQSAGAAGLNAPLPTGTVVQVTPGGAVTPSFDTSLALTGLSGAPSYPSSTTFTLDFEVAGILTVSPTPSLDLDFRALAGGGGTNDYDVSHTGGTLNVAVADGAYEWSALSAGAGTLPAVAATTGATSMALDYTAALPLAPGASSVYDGTVVRSDDTHPASVVPVTVSAIELLLGLSLTVETLGGTTLPNGESGNAYSRGIVAGGTSGLPAPSFAWSVTGGGGLDITNTGNPGNLTGNISAAAGTDLAIMVTCTESVGGIDVAEGNATFALHVDAPAMTTTVDAALLLDRSGSMVNDGRWTSAISGAQAFTNLIKLENDTAGSSHTVSVLWFGGWGSSGDLNYDPVGFPGNPAATNLPGNPHGPENAGTLRTNPADPATALDFAIPTASTAADIGTAGGANDTPYWTALGTGILHARDRLLTRPAANTRLLLALTDGEENRPPLVSSITGAEWGSPDIHLYGIAIETVSGELALEAAAGLGLAPAGSVKDAAPYVAAEVQGWFEDRFQSLFGWVPMTALLDPPIGLGETHVHDLEVTLADGVFVFTAYFNEPPPAQGFAGDAPWELALQPPGPAGLLITESGGGVTFEQGEMYLRAIVRLPLALEGHAHRWPGTWKAHLTCNVRGGSSYGPSAIKRALDPRNPSDQAKLVATVTHDGSPHAGEGAEVLAWVTQDGAALQDARVEGFVLQPGAWPGELLAKTIERMQKEGSLRDEDPVHGTPAAQAQRLLIAEGSWPVGAQRKLSFAYDEKAGVYRAPMELVEAGRHRVHVTADGRARAPSFTPPAFEKAVEQLPVYYQGQALSAERAALEAALEQRYHLEQHAGVGVPFLPSEKQTRAYGRLVGRERVRLQVTPRDNKGALLGPGRGRQVSFHSPRGDKLSWEATDAGNGLYYVDIDLRTDLQNKERPYLLGTRALWARRAKLKLRDRWVKLGGSRLSLDGFYARVLGVHVPVPVRPAFEFAAPKGLRRHGLLEFYAAAAQETGALKQKQVALPASQFRALRETAAQVSSLLRAELKPSGRAGGFATAGVRIAELRLRGLADLLADSPAEAAADALTDALSVLPESLSGASSEAGVSHFLQSLASVRNLVDELAGAVTEGDDDCGARGQGDKDDKGGKPGKHSKRGKA